MKLSVLIVSRSRYLYHNVEQLPRCSTFGFMSSVGQPDEEEPVSPLKIKINVILLVCFIRYKQSVCTRLLKSDSSLGDAFSVPLCCLALEPLFKCLLWCLLSVHYDVKLSTAAFSALMPTGLGHGCGLDSHTVINAGFDYQTPSGFQNGKVSQVSVWYQTMTATHHLGICFKHARGQLVR